MEAVDRMENIYERGGHTGRRRMMESWGDYESSVRFESSGSSVIHDGITITIEERASAIDVGVCKRTTPSYRSGLVTIFKVSTMELFLASVREIAAEWGRNAPHTELRLTFVESGYLISGKLLTKRILLWKTDL